MFPSLHTAGFEAVALALLLFMASLLRCLLHSNHSKTLLSVEEVAMSGASLKLQSHSLIYIIKILGHLLEGRGVTKCLDLFTRGRKGVNEELKCHYVILKFSLIE